jgi:hypothetical protein
MIRQFFLGFSKIRILLYQASKDPGVLAEARGKIAEPVYEALEDNRDV